MLEQKDKAEQMPERPQCAGEEAEIDQKLIVIMRDLNHVMRSLYEGKASQKRILIILKEAGSITQRDLTMRLGIQPGSASEILSKLENAGFIRRVVSETDRRTADLTLTDKGEQMALEAAEQRSRRHEEMFSCLSQEEKEELLALLEKVNVDWAKRYGAAAEEHRQRHRAHRGECGHRHGCENGHRCGHGQEPGHEHGHGQEPGHEHGHGQEPGHEHGHGQEPGYEHGHGQEPGHEHMHRQEHGNEHEHGDGHGHENEHEPGHAHGHGNGHEKHHMETEEHVHVEIH